MSSVEGEPKAEEIGEQQNPSEREVGEVYEEGEDGGEDREVKVLADEDGVVREKRGVEGELDARDVKSTILGQRVVTVKEQCGEGKQDEQGKPGKSVPRFVL
jgi:hypothetical protein